MNLKETFIKYAPDIITNRTPISAASLEDFADIMKREFGSGVIAKPFMKGEIFDELEEGRGNRYQRYIRYTNQYISTTSKGREIIFNEVHKEKLNKNQLLTSPTPNF